MALAFINLNYCTSGKFPPQCLNSCSSVGDNFRRNYRWMRQYHRSDGLLEFAIAARSPGLIWPLLPLCSSLIWLDSSRFGLIRPLVPCQLLETGLFRTSRQINEWTSWGLVNRNKMYLSCWLWCQNTFVACKAYDDPHLLWMRIKDGLVAKSWHYGFSDVLRYMSTYCISSFGVDK